MVKSVKEFMKKILTMAMIMIILVFFVIDPYAKAAQLPAEGEFYYAGTTKGTYVVTENIFEWLMNHLGDIIDWILGFITMAFRMSFVGWATIFEWTLTKTLESTIGIDGLNDAMSSTNVSSANDSSQNVTVEAIVYNNVPLFNVDFFDFEVDVTKTGTGRDLTILVCESCNKHYDECTCTDCPKGDRSCACCETKVIMTEVAADAENKSIVIMIKKTVAEWFYTIRIIALAGMLVVLVAVGIKMLISTLASEKAVYKRMLVDWLVGFIFMFAIEYIIFFIININNMLVNAIEEYAKSPESLATQITKAEFGDSEKTDEELEISVYEAVRTRAYDIKLINGLTGMVMYITLVVFSWRYSWMYLKRYFTLIVLTLMAPAVAFSYSIQKVFTGKAKSWSTWLQEYIVNVLIQTIHAILYASFVSIALAISLNSIAGMIVAFILMNFMLKADKIFRKIFKMSSDGSLLDRVSKGAEEARFDNMLKSAQSAIVGAKPAMNVLAKTPAAAAIRTSGRVVLGESVAAGAKFKHWLDSKKTTTGEEYDFSASDQDVKGAEALLAKGDAHMAKADDARRRLAELEKKKVKGNERSKKNKEMNNLRSEIATQEKAARADYGRAASQAEAALRKAPQLSAQAQMFAMTQQQKSAELNKKVKAEQAALHAAMQAQAEGKSNKDQKALFDEYNRAKKERKAFEKKIRQTEAAVAKKGGLFDYDKYYDENGKRKRTYEYNPATGKLEKNGLHAKVMSQMNMKDLFGMDEEEQKLALKAVSASMSGFVGMASMFMGFGTIVASPAVGMGLLAYGANKFGTYSRVNRNISKPTHRSEYANRNYYGMEFSSDAVKNMARVIEDEIKEDIALLDTPKASKKYTSTDRKQAKERLARNRKKQEAMMIVEKMYASGDATDTRRMTLRLADSMIDNLAGGYGEALDEWTKYSNDKKLQQIADFEREMTQIKGKAQEIDLYRALGEIDRVSAIEDKNSGALFVSEDGDTRISIGGKPMTDASSEILRQAMLEIRGVKAEDSYEERQAKMKAEFTADEKAKIIEKVKELSKGKETGTFDVFAQAAAKEMEELGIDEATRKAYEQERAERKSNVTETPDVAVGKTVDDLITQAMKEFGMDTNPQALSLSMKSKIIERVIELAKERGIELKERFKEEHGKSVVIKDGKFDEAMQNAMDKAIEKKIFDQIDTKINSEIINKVDGAVKKLQSDSADDAIRKKRKDIKLDNVEEAAKDYEITEAEKFAIANAVKEQIKKDKLTKVEDIKAKKSSVIEAYVKASNGTVSTEEAAVQVEVFMSTLQSEDTLKGRTKKVVQESLKKGEKSEIGMAAKVEDAAQRVNIIQQMRQGIVVPASKEPSIDVIAEQNRVVEGLLSKMSDTYRMNSETASQYGKKSQNPTDYKQYVKIQGSSNYQTAKKGQKTGRSTAHLPMGDDPGVYGPLVGLEKIVKNM